MDTNTAIAILLAKHRKEVEEAEAKTKAAPIVIRNAPTPKAEVKTISKASSVPKPEYVSTTHSTTGQNVFGLALPAIGTLDAGSFMIAMRDAGKRAFKVMNAKNEEVIVRKVDQSKVRNDQIIAIAGYCGYDIRENFGPQDMAARAKAAHEIGYAKKVVRAEDGHIASRSEENKKAAQGTAYIAGVNDHMQKHQMQLRGLEKALVETMIDQQKIVDRICSVLMPDGRINVLLTPGEIEEMSAMHKGSAAELAITQAKLAQVREDIRINVKTEATF